MRTLLASVLCLLSIVSTSAQPSPAKPNLVLIVADDLGSSDTGYAGAADIRTPHLDRLAASGTRLTQFYVQPLCSPTRAALMTGRYPMRHGLQTGVVKPWATYGLPLEERILPQALKSAGYRTVILGKWHLGCHEPEYLPHRRGFDHHYGHYLGAIDYFDHSRDGGLDWHRNGETLREEGYSTDLLAAEGERLVAAHDPATPLFLYVPFNAPHEPLQATPSLLGRYPDLKGNRKLYAAMVSGVDDAVGRIVAALEKRGMLANTLIVFTSDNGGPTGSGATNGALRAGKGSLYEGGVRSAAFATWPGRVRAGAAYDGVLHAVDVFPTLLGLAGVSTDQPLPLDGKDAWAAIAEGKPSPREEILMNIEQTRGAIRRGDWKLVWGGHQPAEPDEEGGGAATDDKRQGKGRKPKAGKDAEPNPDALALFNLAEDPGETTDLAAKHPDQVKELKARLDAYAAEAVPAKSRPPAKDFRAPEIWGPAVKNDEDQKTNPK